MLKNPLKSFDMPKNAYFWQHLAVRLFNSLNML